MAIYPNCVITSKPSYMKIYNQPTELIIDSSSVAPKSRTDGLQKQLATADILIEKTIQRSPIMPSQQGIQAKSICAAPAEKQYVKTKLTDTEINLWDAWGELQGCYSLEKDMTNALCASTPNVQWASGDDSLIEFLGAGASSATPQVATAATSVALKTSLIKTGIKAKKKIAVSAA